MIQLFARCLHMRWSSVWYLVNRLLFVLPCAQPHITPHRLGVLLGVNAQPLSLCDELSIRALAVNGHYYLQALGTENTGLREASRLPTPNVPWRSRGGDVTLCTAEPSAIERDRYLCRVATLRPQRTVCGYAPPVHLARVGRVLDLVTKS